MLMQSVYLIIGRWGISVLFGNVLGAGIGILNFFLLGLSVQKAVASDEKKAKEVMRGSHALRFAGIIVLIAVSLIFPKVFDIVATIISLLFASTAVFFRQIFVKKNNKTKGEAVEAVEPNEGGVEQ
jgi:membrane protein YqaA with SNARE-associated domain